MATIRTTFLTGTTLAVMLSGATAFAQDANIYYVTPTIQSGQPVTGGAAVVTTVPVQALPPQMEAGAPAPVTPVTTADEDYLGAPQVQVSQYAQDVTFVSGGIGAYEKQWFTERAKDYKLKVTYTDATGHHLAGVNATLANNDGTVVSTVTDGPYLLVNAKPGTYTLTSSYQGEESSRKVTLGKSLSSAVVVFKNANYQD